MSDPKLDHMKRPQSPNRSSHHPDPGHHTWSLLLLHGICQWLCLKNIKIVFASLKQTTPGLKALPWIIWVSKGEKHPRKAPVLMNHKPKLEQATGFAPHSARCPCSEMSEPVQVQMTVRQCQDSVQLFRTVAGISANIHQHIPSFIQCSVRHGFHSSRMTSACDRKQSTCQMLLSKPASRQAPPAQVTPTACSHKSLLFERQGIQVWLTESEVIET